MPPSSILIVADDPLVQAGLSQRLRPDDEGPSLTVAGPADVIDTDADVCVWDFAGAPELAADVLPPVLALVAHDEAGAEALAWGARGVLERTDTRLLSAVYAVADGHNVIGQSLSGLLPTPAEPRGAPVRLTPREEEVLGLLSDGLSNRAIAEALSVSVHTARFHVQSLLDKLGAETRTEAVALAFRAGLVEL